MQSSFVADGAERVADAIRSEVVAEFAEKRAAATTTWQRFLLWWAIRAEVNRRINKTASNRALYAEWPSD